MAISDDHVVSLYLQISEALTQLNTDQHIKLIQWIEKEYINEADSPLGDYLNDMCLIFFTDLYEDELHDKIRTLIYDSELDYDMLYEVGKTILENRLLIPTY